jgi:hypothetical protein
VVNLEVTHPVKKDIKGHAQELVADDNIRVGFM